MFMAITAFKTHCVKKRVNIHISTSPFSYTCNVERHNHSFLGPSVPAGDPHGINPFLASQRVPISGPHRLVHAPPISSWAMALIKFVTTHPQRHNIVRFWLPKLDFPRGHPS
jgi:hypothetical protein